MGPWADRFTDDEIRADLAVSGLSDAELAILALYRGTLAANTVPGHPDHGRAVERLRAVYAEMSRRQRERLP